MINDWTGRQQMESMNKTMGSPQFDCSLVLFEQLKARLKQEIFDCDNAELLDMV